MKDNILVLGGDERQLHAAKNFSSNGFDTEIYGFSEAEATKLRKAKSLEAGIERADIVVLPMPVSTDGEYLNAPLNSKFISLESINSLITPTKKIYGGIIKEGVFTKSRFVTDYSLMEMLTVKNAALTAEGAIGMMVSSSPSGIYDSKILITGYGRIGKILAGYLKSLGGIPIVAARKESDYAWCDFSGIKYIGYQDLKKTASECEFLINTVPYKVIDEDVISTLKTSCVVIDLASKPGGCDFEALGKKGIKYFHALGLPGKFSPKTAGKIISSAIIGKEKGLKTNE